MEWSKMTRTGVALLCVIVAVTIVSRCSNDVDPVTSPSDGIEQIRPDQINDAELYGMDGTSSLGKTAITCPSNRYCGPMDVVFVIDNTGSMGGAITNVKTELNDILDCVDDVSGNDYRLALVTFKDNITIHHNFAANNKGVVGPSIMALTATGGWNEPEASDEALNTVINELTTTGRPQQNMNFAPGWRAGAKKVIILVTDARPGGFDDTYTIADNAHAELMAVQAAAAGIAISAIYTETEYNTGNSPTIEAIMQNYATETSGVYVKIPWTSYGAGTGSAMINIIGTCGLAEIPISIDIKPGSCPNPVNTVAGGIIPVAILGDASFDVTQVDFTTIELNGVSPNNWQSPGDVGTPYLSSLVDCYDCNTAGADGFTDLKLKFDNQALVASLGAVSSGDCVVLELTGNLLPAYGGTPIRGGDIVKIVP